MDGYGYGYGRLLCFGSLLEGVDLNGRWEDDDLQFMFFCGTNKCIQEILAKAQAEAAAAAPPQAEKEEAAAEAVAEGKK